jgi:hypothetical protein
MSLDEQASQDFESALTRSFWRRVLARLTGHKIDLLPFDEVRARLPLGGQHYLGMRQVEISKIVGSSGRYRDFDRAFLPIQNKTRDRWVSIDKAYYQQVYLPPVELYKIGDAYFVKDGNHRVSVAREWGQDFIDAYVIEIDVPIQIGPDVTLQELEHKKEYAEFLLHTGIHELFPDANLEASDPIRYGALLEHIATHRWYLNERRKAEVSYREAVISWYTTVYLPVVEGVRQTRLPAAFPGFSEAELYLFLITYQGVLRRLSLDEAASEGRARSEAARQVAETYPHPQIGRLLAELSRAKWLDELVLNHEHALFEEQTQLHELRPQAEVRPTIPGGYAALLEHIRAHRWYMGEQRQAEVAESEAVISWYENVYLPLVEIIREQGILHSFPDRSEADLYLWIITHQWSLREVYGQDVSLDEAAEQFTDEKTRKPANRR